MASAWSGTGTQFVIGSNKISARNGTIIWAVLAAADILESLDSKLTYANNYLKAIDTSTKNLYKYTYEQWGWDYGLSTEGWRPNSPAAWLNKLMTDTRAQWGYKVGSAWVSEKNSPYYFLDWIYQVAYNAWGYNYGNGPVYHKESPAGWLEQTRDLLDGDKGAGYWLKWIYNSQWTAWGGNYETGSPSIINESPAGWLKHIDDYWLKWIYNSTWTAWGGNYNTDSPSIIGDSPAGWLQSLYKNNYSQWGWDYGLSTEGWRPDSPAAWLRSIKVETDGLSSRLSSLSRLDDIFLALDSCTGISRLLAEWADRWDTQDRMMVEWGNAWEAYRDSVLSALGGGLSLDVSGIESRLDDIRGLLLAAGMAENAKDLLDLLIGDLSGIGQAAATGAIQGAMESAFPFCVPAVVKQVFGLLAYEGSAPVWEFDICGHPLVCDFSGFQLVADCTSWLSRVGLVLALLVNTRKFVFSINGGGSS